jgi:hypothetical protein
MRGAPTADYPYKPGSPSILGRPPRFRDFQRTKRESPSDAGGSELNAKCPHRRVNIACDFTVESHSMEIPDGGASPRAIRQRDLRRRR